MDYVYCFVWILLSIVHTARGEYAYVTVDSSIEGQGQCRLPSTIWFSVKTESETLTLNLKRNDHVHPNVPVYIIRTGHNGNREFIKDDTMETKHHAAYQDPHHETAVFVTCHLHSKTGTKLEMEGTLFLGSVKYHIFPSKSPLSFYQRLFHSENEKLYHLIRAKEAIPFDSGIEAVHHEEILSNTMEEIRLPADHTRRIKRGTPNQEPQNINIDILVLLENSVMQEWSAREGGIEQGRIKAKEYFAHVVNAVNLRYQSITNDVYRFNVRLVGYYLSETADTSPWSENNAVLVDGIKRTNASSVLTNLQEWVNANKNQLIPHDHVMLFTSYDLTGDDNGFRFNYTTGFAYLRSMCDTDGFSISIVEDHGGFQSVGTAAHELGHSLGAQHDGINNSCPATDRYMMAPLSYNETEANKFNPWFFSTCSVLYFVNYINDVISLPGRETCLTGSLTPEGDIPDVASQMPGQLYDPDAQCQHLYGNRSYLCRGTSFDVGNIICRALFCYQPNLALCLLVTAARGTTCGNKKWCISGQCVESVDAPAVDDTCVHGDQPRVTVPQRETTCNTEISAQPGLCYLTGWSSVCCATCQLACDGPPDCRCRDRQALCVESDCGLYDEPTRSACCYTCRNYVPTTTTTTTTTSTSATSMTTTTTTTTQPVTYPSTCVDVPQFEGVTCAAFVQNFGRQICYTDHVNRSCCEACKNRSTPGNENCPWGDYSPLSCKLLKGFINGYICPIGDLNDKCCETCQALKDGLLLPPPVNTNNTTSRGDATLPSALMVATFGIVVCVISGYCLY